MNRRRGFFRQIISKYEANIAAQSAWFICLVKAKLAADMQRKPQIGTRSTLELETICCETRNSRSSNDATSCPLRFRTSMDVKMTIVHR